MISILQLLNEAIMDSAISDIVKLVAKTIKSDSKKSYIEQKINISGYEIELIVSFSDIPSYSPAVGAVFHPTDNQIRIDIIYDENKISRDIDKILTSFKGQLRHELTHFMQHHKIYAADKTPPYYVYGIDYAKHPDEIAAWVMGMHAEAKRKKINLIDVMKQTISSKEFPEKLTDRQKNVVISLWKKYAIKKNIPLKIK